MEAPDYCYAFNFLRANSPGAAGGCRVRPAGTAPERGRDAQPPPTPSSLLHPPASTAVLPWGPPNAPPRRREPPRAREPAAGARRAPAVWLPRRRQRGGARGLPARPAVGSARPRADSPRLLGNLRTHAGEVPRQRLESQTLERKSWPPSRLERWGSCFSPQAFVSKSATGALLEESWLWGRKERRNSRETPHNLTPCKNTPLSAGDFKALLPSPEPSEQHKHGVDANSALAIPAPVIVANSEHIGMAINQVCTVTPSRQIKNQRQQQQQQQHENHSFCCRTLKQTSDQKFKRILINQVLQYTQVTDLC